MANKASTAVATVLLRIFVFTNIKAQCFLWLSGAGDSFDSVPATSGVPDFEPKVRPASLSSSFQQSDAVTLESSQRLHLLPETNSKSAKAPRAQPHVIGRTSRLGVCSTAFFSDRHAKSFNLCSLWSERALLRRGLLLRFRRNSTPSR